MDSLCVEADKQALQEAMKATFVRGRKQDLELTHPDIKDYGLRPGKASSEAVRNPLSAGPLPKAAEDFLKTGENRFAAQSSILEPEAKAGGLSMPKQTTQPPAPEVSPYLAVAVSMSTPKLSQSNIHSPKPLRASSHSS